MNEARQITVKHLEALLHDGDFNQLSDKLTRFNIFEAIGMVHQEIRHSRTLAFFLDPTKPHGIGSDFLKRFIGLTNIGQPTSISIGNLDNTFVRTENKNIDISIVNHDSRFVIAIENKIWAGEHGDQLSSYHTQVEQDWPGYDRKFILLTRKGRKPTRQRDRESWIGIAYPDILRELIELCGHDGTQLLISHYVSMMEKHILGDEEAVKRAKELYRRHEKALDFIFQNRPEEPFIEDFREWAREQGFENRPSTSFINRFRPPEWENRENTHSRGDWKGEAILFEGNITSDGKMKLELVISEKAKNGRINDKGPSLLEEFSEKYGLNNLNTNQGYPRIWESPYSLNANQDFQSQREIVETRWLPLINELSPKVFDVLEDRRRRVGDS